MSSEINANDVVRLMLQYMKENNLMSSMRILQSETGVCMNTVDNIETFISDIQYGRWDSVLAQVTSLQLPQDKLISLYEQVVLELIENKDIDMAREILRTTQPFAILKHLELSRYMRLEQLASKPYFNAADAYAMGMTKELRRQEIADALACEVTVAPNSRLLVLIGQAMKYQQLSDSSLIQSVSGSSGSINSAAVKSVDLFCDSGSKASGVNKKKDIGEILVKRQMGNIAFPIESHPETVIFSPDGSSTMVTGSVDGFIEVWEIDQCKLRKDLEYQARDELMMHSADVNGVPQPAAVICSTFSTDGEHLATGSQDGQIKVWKLSTGACLRKIPHAHTGGVTSISFNKDNSQVLTTSFDGLARIHGLKSGKLIKEFRGHGSFVNCSVISRDSAHILTGSSDGTCRLWDYQTTECLFVFRPGVTTGSVVTDASVHTILLLPNTPAYKDQVIVCVKHYQAYLMTLQGKVLRTYSSGKQSGGNFTCATMSHQGKWLYCAGEDGVVYMFDVVSGLLENVLDVIVPESGQQALINSSVVIPVKQNVNAHTMAVNTARPVREIIAIAHHAQRNIVVTVTDDGKLTLWKP